jgi:hypothetical protein
VGSEEGFKRLEASTSNGSLSLRRLSEAVCMSSNGNLRVGDDEGSRMVPCHCLETIGEIGMISSSILGSVYQRALNPEVTTRERSGH